MKTFHILTILLLLFVSSFSCSQKTNSEPEIVVDNAAWCWFSDPRAIYHNGEHEKIYYGFINNNGDVVARSYDLNTQEEDEFTLHSKLQIDDHNVPTFLFLPDGKILTFYNEHSGNIFMRKSENIESISEWGDERILLNKDSLSRYCYVNPVMLSGENDRIYLFGRNINRNPATYSQTKIYCIYSDDYGETWSDEINIFDNDGRDSPQYVKYSTDNKSRIDFLFTDGHPRHGNISVYHMYYEDGKFNQTNGQVISSFADAPVKIKSVNKVYDAEKEDVRAWIWDITLDKNNYPVITYTRYPTYLDHQYFYARWTGDKWNHVKVADAGSYITIIKPDTKLREQHYSGGIVLDHNNPEVVYLSRKKGKKFEIEKRIISGNGQQKIYPITENSNVDNVRPYIVNNGKSDDPILFWMSGNYYHYTDYNTDLRIKFY